MAPAIDILLQPFPKSKVLRCGLSALTLCCAALLFFYGVGWAACIAMLILLAALAEWKTLISMTGRFGPQRRATLTSPVAHDEVVVESAFSGWGFTVVWARGEARRHTLLVAHASMSAGNLSRFGRWLKSSQLT